MLHKTLGETKGDLTCTPHGEQRHEHLTSQHLEMLLRRAHHSPYSLPVHHPLLSSADVASRHSSDKETTQVRDKKPKDCLLLTDCVALDEFFYFYEPLGPHWN